MSMPGFSKVSKAVCRRVLHASAAGAAEGGEAAAGGSKPQQPEEPKGWFELKVSRANDMPGAC
jgi:hypothetical protein